MFWSFSENITHKVDKEVTEVTKYKIVDCLVEYKKKILIIIKLRILYSLIEFLIDTMSSDKKLLLK